MPSGYNPSETARDWETLQKDSESSYTQRLRVHGGWLYRTVMGTSVALVFVSVHDESIDG